VSRAASPVVDGTAQEAAALSELALRSKGYRGYDAAFLEACRGELLMLFVDPPAIGSGVGRVLLDDALRYASRLGWSALRIESDDGSDSI
jgi:GNAT superfamily N-acetyltransferase